MRNNLIDILITPIAEFATHGGSIVGFEEFLAGRYSRLLAPWVVMVRKFRNVCLDTELAISTRHVWRLTIPQLTASHC